MVGTAKGYLLLFEKHSRNRITDCATDRSNDGSIEQLWLDHEHIVATYKSGYIKVWKIHKQYMWPVFETQVKSDTCFARVVNRKNELLLVVGHGELKLATFDLSKAGINNDLVEVSLNKATRAALKLDEYNHEIMYMDAYGRVLAWRSIYEEDEIEDGEVAKVEAHIVVDAVTGKNMGTLEFTADQADGCGRGEGRLYNPTPDCLLQVLYRIPESTEAGQYTLSVWEYRCQKGESPVWLEVSPEEVRKEEEHVQLINDIIPGPLGILFLCRESVFLREDFGPRNNIVLEGPINAEAVKTCAMQLIRWTDNPARMVDDQPQGKLILDKSRYTTVWLGKLLTDEVRCFNCSDLITGSETLVVKAVTTIGYKHWPDAFYHTKCLRRDDSTGNLLDGLRFMPLPSSDDGE